MQDKKIRGFVAHCLDMDIAAQGKTQSEALEELKHLIQSQLEYCLENKMLETVFRPAPKEYWDRFYSSRQRNIIQQLSKRKVLIRELTSNFELSYA